MSKAPRAPVAVRIPYPSDTRFSIPYPALSTISGHTHTETRQHSALRGTPHRTDGRPPARTARAARRHSCAASVRTACAPWSPQPTDTQTPPRPRPASAHVKRLSHRDSAACGSVLRTSSSAHHPSRRSRTRHPQVTTTPQTCKITAAPRSCSMRSPQCLAAHRATCKSGGIRGRGACSRSKGPWASTHAGSS